METIGTQILEGLKQELAVLAESEVKIVLLDSSALIETGLYLRCNEVWLCSIQAKEAARRLSNKTSITIDEAEKITDRQMPNWERITYFHIYYLIGLHSHM